MNKETLEFLKTQDYQLNQHSLYEAVGIECTTILKLNDAAKARIKLFEEKGWKIHIECKAWWITVFAYRQWYGERVVTPVYDIDIGKDTMDALFDKLEEECDKYIRMPTKEERSRFKVGTWFMYCPQQGSRYKVKKLKQGGLAALTEEGPEFDLRNTYVYTEEDIKWMKLDEKND